MPNEIFESSNLSKEDYLIFSKSKVKVETVTDSLAQMMDDGGKQRSSGRVSKRKEVHVKLVDWHVKFFFKTKIKTFSVKKKENSFT